jgi:hypothetical protein
LDFLVEPRGYYGLTPEEIFTGIKGCNHLADFHPFGCPVFVLDPMLQQGHKIPRWKPRSRVVVYLGLSPEHASSVPLVLSTSTGLVSPQFHIVFDDYFSTTKCLHTNQIPPNWSTLLTTSCTKYVDDVFDSTNFIDPTWFSDSSSQNEPTISSDQPIQPLSPLEREHTIDTSSSFQRESNNNSNNNLSTLSSTPLQPGWNSYHRYQTRFRQRHIANTAILDTTESSIDTPFDASLYAAFIAVQDSYPITSSTELSFLEHYACASQTNPDVLHYGAMLRDPDRTFFETDMQREISDLFRTDTVEIVCRSLLSLGIKILQAIWSFRCKRAPDWSILKHKARIF